MWKMMSMGQVLASSMVDFKFNSLGVTGWVGSALPSYVWSWRGWKKQTRSGKMWKVPVFLGFQGRKIADSHFYAGCKTLPCSLAEGKQPISARRSWVGWFGGTSQVQRMPTLRPSKVNKNGRPCSMMSYIYITIYGYIVISINGYPQIS